MYEEEQRKTKESLACCFAEIFWDQIYRRSMRNGTEYNDEIQRYTDVMKSEDIDRKGSLFLSLMSAVSRNYEYFYNIPKRIEDIVHVLYIAIVGRESSKRINQKDEIYIVRSIIVRALSAYTTNIINNKMYMSIVSGRKNSNIPDTLRDMYTEALERSISNYRSRLVEKRNGVKKRDLMDLVPLSELEILRREIRIKDRKIQELEMELSSHKKMVQQYVSIMKSQGKVIEREHPIQITDPLTYEIPPDYNDNVIMEPEDVLTFQ